MTWETVALGDIADLNPRTPPTNDSATFLGMADLGEDGRTTLGVPIEPGELKPGYTPFHDRDILLAKITPCFENGKIGQAELPTKLGWGSTEFHVIRPKVNLVHDRYLFHFLRTPRVRAAGELRMTGSAGQRRVPIVFLRSLRVPLPPLPEQRRIAAILDEADSLRSSARIQSAHFDTAEDLAFESLLGASVAGAETTLGDLAVELRYGTSVKSGMGGLPVLRIPNITGRAIDATQLKTVHLPAAEIERLRLTDRDILFVRSNGNPDVVGRCSTFLSLDAKARGQGDWVYASYLIRARLKPGVAPEAIAALARSRGGRRHLRRGATTSAGQYNINTAALRSLPTFRASHPAQEEFALVSAEINAQRTGAHVRNEKIDALFASLQHRAFRGEL